MQQSEILRQIEELMELENGSLGNETELNSIPEYDSMAKLSLIVFCDDEYSKKLTAEQLNEFVTVNDIIEFLLN